MKVNNITLNCQKPRHFGNLSVDKVPSGRVRYKHYEELSDNELMLKSVLKAHKQTSQETKMKLYKAMPTIAAGIIGTSLAITQPGKLSGKIATGLGFLVATTVATKVANKIDEKVQDKFEKSGNKVSKLKKDLVSVGIQMSALALMLAGFVVGKDKVSKIMTNPNNSFLKLFKKDVNKLADEINNTKLGKYVNGIKDDAATKISKKAGFFAPIATLFAYDGVSTCLKDSINDDISKKAVNNFIKGKFIQQQAREEFDKVEAKEV